MKLQRIILFTLLITLIISISVFGDTSITVKDYIFYCLLALVMLCQKQIMYNKFIKYYIFLLIFFSLCTFFYYNPNLHFKNIIQLLSYGLFILYFFDVIKKNKRQIIGLLSLLVFISFIYAILQFTGNDFMQWTRIYDIKQGLGNRVFAFLGNPNFLAGFTLLMYSYFLSVFLNLETKDYKKNFWINLFLIIICVCLLILTFSRAALLTLFILTIIGFILKFIKDKKITRKIIFVLLTILILSTIFFTLGINDKQWEKGSVLRRAILWNDCLNNTRDNIFIGQGFHSFINNFYTHKSYFYFNFFKDENNFVNTAHSQWIELFYETGIIGFGFFIFVVFLLIRNFYFKRQFDKLLILFSILIYGFFTTKINWFFIIIPFLILILDFDIETKKVKINFMVRFLLFLLFLFPLKNYIGECLNTAGNSYKKTGNFSKANYYLANANILDDNNFYKYNLAKLYSLADKTKECIQVLNMISNRFVFADVNILLASKLEKLRVPAEARYYALNSYIHREVDKFPLSLYFRTLYDLKEYDTIKQIINLKKIKEEVESDKLNLLLANIYSQENNFIKADNYYKKALANTNQADIITEYRIVSCLKNSNPYSVVEAMKKKIYFLYKTKFQAYQKILDQLIEKEKNNSSLLEIISEYLYKNNDKLNALNNLMLINERERNFYSARFYLKTGRIEEAKKRFKLYLQSNKYNINSILSVGTELFLNNNSKLLEELKIKEKYLKQLDNDLYGFLMDGQIPRINKRLDENFMLNKVVDLGFNSVSKNKILYTLDNTAKFIFIITKISDNIGKAKIVIKAGEKKKELSLDMGMIHKGEIFKIILPFKNLKQDDKIIIYTEYDNKPNIAIDLFKVKKIENILNFKDKIVIEKIDILDEKYKPIRIKIKDRNEDIKGQYYFALSYEYCDREKNKTIANTSMPNEVYNNYAYDAFYDIGDGNNFIKIKFIAVDWSKEKPLQTKIRKYFYIATSDLYQGENNLYKKDEEKNNIILKGIDFNSIAAKEYLNWCIDKKLYYEAVNLFQLMLKNNALPQNEIIRIIERLQKIDEIKNKLSDLLYNYLDNKLYENIFKEQKQANYLLSGLEIISKHIEEKNNKIIIQISLNDQYNQLQDKHFEVWNKYIFVENLENKIIKKKNADVFIETSIDMDKLRFKEVLNIYLLDNNLKFQNEYVSIRVK